MNIGDVVQRHDLDWTVTDKFFTDHEKGNVLLITRLSRSVMVWEADLTSISSVV
jgi:hypothetical protein